MIRLFFLLQIDVEFAAETRLVYARSRFESATSSTRTNNCIGSPTASHSSRYSSTESSGNSHARGSYNESVRQSSQLRTQAAHRVGSIPHGPRCIHRHEPFLTRRVLFPWADAYRTKIDTKIASNVCFDEASAGHIGSHQNVVGYEAGYAVRRTRTVLDRFGHPCRLRAVSNFM
jgi:hypothetical protein